MIPSSEVLSAAMQVLRQEHDSAMRKSRELVLDRRGIERRHQAAFERKGIRPRVVYGQGSEGIGYWGQR